MDIEKIKNYNQKMLAVITTAAVAFAVIGLFSFVFFLLAEVFRVFDTNTANYQDEGLATEEPFYDDTENKAPELFVSYRFPHLIDTAKQIFVIPVTHQTSDKIGDDFSRKLSFSSSYNDYKYTYNSTYINFIIYNATENTTEKLFRQKIIISDYQPFYFKDEILVVFEAAEEDTDNNGKISLNDNTSLFIYSITNQQLKRAKIEGKRLLQHQFIGKTKDLVLRFGENTGRRVKQNSEFDVGILCKYSYEKDQLIRINDQKLNEELKKIAEGDKN